MRAKQRSDRDLGTVHALNYFAWGVDGYATSEIAGKILITKFPKFLEETKKERRKEEKKGKSGRKGGREEDPSKQEENACS